MLTSGFYLPIEMHVGDKNNGEEDKGASIERTGHPNPKSLYWLNFGRNCDAHDKRG